MEKQIEPLHLNEDLLLAMFSGTTQSVWLRPKVDVFRACHEDDTTLYYIFKGNVVGVDNKDRSLVLDRYKEQEFFEINEEINTRRKYIASVAVDGAKHNRQAPTTAGPAKQSVSRIEPVAFDEDGEPADGQ